MRGGRGEGKRNRKKEDKQKGGKPKGGVRKPNIAEKDWRKPNGSETPNQCWKPNERLEKFRRSLKNARVGHAYTSTTTRRDSFLPLPSSSFLFLPLPSSSLLFLALPPSSFLFLPHPLFVLIFFRLFSVLFSTFFFLYSLFILFHFFIIFTLFSHILHFPSFSKPFPPSMSLFVYSLLYFFTFSLSLPFLTFIH